MTLSSGDVDDLQAVTELLQKVLPQAEEYRLANKHLEISETDFISAIFAMTHCYENWSLE